jgi:hypothetical protein
VPAKLLEALEALQLHRAEGAEEAPLDAAELARRRFDQQAELDARREGDPDFAFDAADDSGMPDGMPDVLCARCFSLKHTGKVKTLAAEGALPDFDLGRKVGRGGCAQAPRPLPGPPPAPPPATPLPMPALLPDVLGMRRWGRAATEAPHADAAAALGPPPKAATPLAAQSPPPLLCAESSPPPP